MSSEWPGTGLLENIFFCECGEVLISVATKAECSRCERSMEKTGWRESGNKKEDVKDA